MTLEEAEELIAAHFATLNPGEVHFPNSEDDVESRRLVKFTDAAIYSSEYLVERYGWAGKLKHARATGDISNNFGTVDWRDL
jgi:hypothetical protein